MDDIIKYQINNRCFIEPDVEQTQSYQQRNNSEAQNLMKIKTHGFEPLGQITHTSFLIRQNTHGLNICSGKQMCPLSMALQRKTSSLERIVTDFKSRS